MTSILKWLNKPVGSAGLGIFRILFGIIMCWEILYFYRIGFLENFVFGPSTLFYYDFLHLKLGSEIMMEVLLGGLTLSVICITLGVFYRIAIVYFAFVFSYFFLLDKGIYNNHLYLICLLAFMMIFMNADAAFSLNKKGSHQ